MIDLLASTALTLSPPGFAPRAALAAGVTGFDLKLALDCVMPGIAPMTGKPVAGCGKDLPVPGNGVAEGGTDEDEALLAWMPEGMVLLPLETPLPARVAVGTPSAQIDGPIADPVEVAALPIELGETAPLPSDTADGDAFAASLASAPAAPAATPVSTPLRTWRDPVPAQAEPGAGGGVVAAEVRHDRTTAAAPESRTTAALTTAPMTAASVPPLVVQAAPAAQVFAAALAAPLAEPLDTAAPADPASPEIQLLRSLDVQRTTVQATAQADQAPLDLSRDDWTGKMIERIAALRDGVEAADTRIRLAPENLGTVDISIRRDGDRLQVHFTAENPATRQLLADAAPRLAELAEARGLKLGQSSVDGGGTDARGQPHQQQQQSTPARPVSARADTGTASDARVA
ncbi:flagellar hook-length control protein FliK [Sphingomonas sp.]|uniref:flagellar hook-length control protein FliK n=1 Tax=Sphingomonas sp. TaxID=28214 RepID=UPI0017C21DC6|nr:flagellar hook-length control protein FliK [Sphingomonas sp.]MBA4761970.1 flagellar hook-length control protein FliK [Sphingomonas sp.]